MRTIDYRPARQEDSAAIARLFLIASDGLAAYTWARIAAADEPLDSVGARRYARRGVDFSFENCWVAVDEEDRPIGMAHAFPMAARAPGMAPESDPVLAPYAELEEPGSYYLSGLAVERPWRGQGIGRTLLRMAAERAEVFNLPRLSLICFEANSVARSLYRRMGFLERDRRPVVRHPCLRIGWGDALLLSAPAAYVRSRAAGSGRRRFDATRVSAFREAVSC